jgi:hypothetical protein
LSIKLPRSGQNSFTISMHNAQISPSGSTQSASPMQQNAVEMRTVICVKCTRHTKYSSTACTIAGSAKIFPASLQPPQPGHSTKFANIGLPVL